MRSLSIAVAASLTVLALIVGTSYTSAAPKPSGLAQPAPVLMTASSYTAPVFSPWAQLRAWSRFPRTSPELNTPLQDGCPILSRVRLRYLGLEPPGGVGNLDIWVAERDNPDAPFGAPVNMGGPINSAGRDFCPSPLRDGHGFMFAPTDQAAVAARIST